MSIEQNKDISRTSVGFLWAKVDGYQFAYHFDTTSLPLNYYPVLSPYSPSSVLGDIPPSK